MKRNNDLSREILLFVEEHSPPQGGLDAPLKIPGYDDATVVAHAELLIEDDYIDGRINKFMGPAPNIVQIIKLTNRGHDAIAAIQSNATWAAVKKTALEKGVDLAFEVAVALAKRLGASLLGVEFLGAP